jgi:RNA polymerase sigma-70 factor (ECF subfamily)
LDKDAEKAMVEQARKDPAAFGRIFEAYYHKILSYSIYRTMNVEIARDITSETFFKALKNLWQFKWAGAPFSSWLYRIASNEIKMYFRHHKYEPSSLEEAVEENNMPELSSRKDLEAEIMLAQERLDENGELMTVLKALKELPEKYQEVITLRFYQELKIEEIAAMLNSKEGTVKSLLSRGLRMLKEKPAVQPFKDPRILKSKEHLAEEVKCNE